MKRRVVLALSLSAASAGCVESANEVLEEGESNPMNQRLGGDFDRIEFSENGLASLYFKQDHECQGFAIAHTADENLEDHNVMMCQAPRFQGPVQFNILKRAKDAETTFPSNEFNAIGLMGQFVKCESSIKFQVFGEETSRSGFFVPEEIWNQAQDTE